MNDFLLLSRWATWRRGRCQGRRGDADGPLGLALGSSHVRVELRPLHTLSDLMPLPFRSGPEAAELPPPDRKCLSPRPLWGASVLCLGQNLGCRGFPAQIWRHE